HAFGREIEVKKAALADHIVATFSDDAPQAASAYSATILWGDGGVSEGTVRRAPNGEFRVLGSHVYVDPEEFSVLVRIRKTGGGETFAWSRAQLSGFKGQPHLPPFAGANIIGQIIQTPVPGSNPQVAAPVRETVGNQTFGSLEII